MYIRWAVFYLVINGVGCTHVPITRQIKPVQVYSAGQKSLRMGKNKKGVNKQIINYSYRNTSATNPVNN